MKTLRERVARGEIPISNGAIGNKPALDRGAAWPHDGNELPK